MARDRRAAHHPRIADVQLGLSRATSTVVRLAIGPGTAQIAIEPQTDGRVEGTVIHETLSLEDVDLWKGPLGGVARRLGRGLGHLRFSLSPDERTAFRGFHASSQCESVRSETDRPEEDAGMSSYEDAIDILETELTGVEANFNGLSPEEWARPTKLVPIDPAQKPWTVFELAGHFDISIGLTRMLIDSKQDGQPGRDRVSFFIFPRSEVAPVVYDYAYTMVEGKTPADMPGVLHETFSKTIEESRASAPDTIGSGYYALMRLDEFVPSRIVEAVVHGFDLTDALGRDSIATQAGIAATAQILDELLARRTVPGRPTDLSDDLAWIRAASGRAEHSDPRLPLIG